MLRRNHSRIILACVRIFPVELGDGCADGFNKFVCDRLVRKNIIGCDTRLTSVDILGPSDAPCSDGDVCRRVDNGWALAAQLESYRREVLCSGAHDNTANCPVAGIEDVIKFLFEQLCCLLYPTLDDGDGLVGEILRHNLCKHSRCFGRDFRWLHHYCVSGSDGASNGNEQQLNGIVPGRDHAYNAKRLRNSHRRGRSGDHWGGHFSGCRPLLQVFQHQFDFSNGETNVVEPGLFYPASKIDFESSRQLILMLLEHRDHCFELGLAPRQGPSDSRVKRLSGLLNYR